MASIFNVMYLYLSTDKYSMIFNVSMCIQYNMSSPEQWHVHSSVNGNECACLYCHVFVHMYVWVNIYSVTKRIPRHDFF